MALSILFVEHDASARHRIADVLRRKGHVVRTATESEEAAAFLRTERYHLVIADLEPTDVSELRTALPADAHPEFLMLADDPGDPRAVAAVREAVADLLVKPFEIEQVVNRVSQLDRRVTLELELEQARAALAKGAGQGSWPGMIGRSAPMRRVLELIDTFGASEASVLITGETGTGKEIAARLLHQRSPRASKPLISVNCAAMPETLLESELFGHERGAFTGAVHRRDGRFKAADGATLFLDEIAEIPFSAQAKLVRVLQEGVFEPLGTNRPLKVDVRILSATHRDLAARVAAGSFREDLYYRLNTLPLAIPSLRERPGDLPLLVDHFLAQFGADARRPGMTGRAWEALSRYPFPGNVRELEHAVQHAVVLARGGEIDVVHLPPTICEVDAAAPTTSTSGFRHLHGAVREFERDHILRALRLSHGRRGEAAGLLGISRKNLWEKLRAHGLSDGEVASSAAGGKR